MLIVCGVHSVGTHNKIIYLRANYSVAIIFVKGSRGLWEIQTEAIIDVIFIDADTETYAKYGIYTIFPRWEKRRRKKTGGASTSNGNLFSVCTLS